MGIFTTHEIAIFIYGILLLMYILVRNKGKDILLPVIKAACHKSAISLMRAIKLNDYFMSFGLIVFCFAIFFGLSFTQVAAKINLDLAALIFTILCQVGIFLKM